MAQTLTCMVALHGMGIENVAKEKSQGYAGGLHQHLLQVAVHA